MVLVTLSSLAVPYLLKVAIDGGIGAKDMTVLTRVIVVFIAVSLINLGASIGANEKTFDLAAVLGVLLAAAWFHQEHFVLLMMTTAALPSRS